MIRIISFAAVCLFAVMSGVHAQNDPQILHEILVHIKTQTEKQTNYLDHIPVRVQELLQTGSDSADRLERALSDGDLDAARNNFQTGMASYKEITQIFALQYIVQHSSIGSEGRDLISEFEEVRDYARFLNEFASDYHDVDFDEADSLINATRMHIRDGLYDEAESTLDRAKNVLALIHTQLDEAVSDSTATRVDNYKRTHIEDIERLLPSIRDTNSTAHDELLDIRKKLAITSDPEEISNLIRDAISIIEEAQKKILNSTHPANGTSSQD